MLSLYKLITKTNLKSPTLAFPLIMPLIFVLLYATGIGTGLDQAGVDAMVATFFVTILSVTTMQSGLMGFGINFISIKKSVLLKRIGATELDKKDVIFAVLMYGLTLWLITFVWVIISISLFSAMGVFVSEAGYSITNIKGIDTITGFTDTPYKASMFGWMTGGYINWGRLALATLVMIYASYGLGIFFTAIAKDDQMYMGMAMLYFFFASFMGGIMFPGDTPQWMQYVGYLVPHSYVGPIYDWAAGAEIGSAAGQIPIWKFSLGIIVPVLFGTLVTIAGIKVLKFD